MAYRLLRREGWRVKKASAMALARGGAAATHTDEAKAGTARR